MSIQFACESCGKAFTVKDEMAGMKGKCSACGATMRIPTSPASVAPSPPAPVFEARPTPRESGATNVQVVVNQDAGKSANGLGVAAVVLGILSILICWIPLVSLFAIPLIFIGGILALVGLIVALTNKKSGVGWPITGMGLNAFAFVVMLIVNVVLAGTIGASVDAARDAARKAEAKAKASARPVAPADVLPDAPKKPG